MGIEKSQNAKRQESRKQSHCKGKLLRPSSQRESISQAAKFSWLIGEGASYHHHPLHCQSLLSCQSVPPPQAWWELFVGRAVESCLNWWHHSERKMKSIDLIFISLAYFAHLTLWVTTHLSLLQQIQDNRHNDARDEVRQQENHHVFPAQQ